MRWTTRSVRVAALGLGASLVPMSARAEMDAGPFAEGSVRLSVILGSATVGESRAIILGAGAGYYLVDGLELGLEGEYWIGADPSISKLSPQARYVLWFVPVLKPYVGAFYRHVFVGSPYDDIDSIGTRAGAFWVSGGGSYFGGGVVYEQLVKGCPEGWECASWYPELMISLSF